MLLGNVESQHRHAAQLNTHANGIAERWVGSCRRDLLDHVIALNERHLKRLLSEYVSYHHEDRTHWGLGKETPGGRTRSLPSGHVGSQPRLGGLHNEAVLLPVTRRNQALHLKTRRRNQKFSSMVTFDSQVRKT